MLIHPRPSMAGKCCVQGNWTITLLHMIRSQGADSACPFHFLHRTMSAGGLKLFPSNQSISEGVNAWCRAASGPGNCRDGLWLLQRLGPGQGLNCHPHCTACPRGHRSADFRPHCLHQCGPTAFPPCCQCSCTLARMHHLAQHEMIILSQLTIIWLNIISQ